MARTISELWHDEFTSTGHCVICGNHGIIDTRGKVFTPHGVECGDRVFCICPNGRALRRAAARKIRIVPFE